MNIRWRSQFKKDYKQMIKQGKDINKLDYVINELAIPNPLDDKYHDHSLKGPFERYKECHIETDWLLIYGYESLKDDECQLLLVRTGSHSELFE